VKSPRVAPIGPALDHIPLIQPRQHDHYAHLLLNNHPQEVKGRRLSGALGRNELARLPVALNVRGVDEVGVWSVLDRLQPHPIVVVGINVLVAGLALVRYFQRVLKERGKII